MSKGALNGRYGATPFCLWHYSAMTLDPDNKKLPAKKATQDYDLIHGLYQLDVRPKLLLLLTIAHIDPLRPPSEQKGFSTTITAKEWQETFPGSSQPYRDLQLAAEGLLGKRVWIIPSKKWRHWIRGAEYHEGEGAITITLEDSLLPFLCAPGGLVRFASVNLSHVSGLRRFSSIRLYELLNQFAYSGVRQIAVDELRGILCGDSYPRYADFSRKCLDPAVSEINKKTNLRVKCEQIKKGRKVEALKFYIAENAQQSLFR
jgi:hypothetical protein